MRIIRVTRECPFFYLIFFLSFDCVHFEITITIYTNRKLVNAMKSINKERYVGFWVLA